MTRDSVIKAVGAASVALIAGAGIAVIAGKKDHTAPAKVVYAAPPLKCAEAKATIIATAEIPGVQVRCVSIEKRGDGWIVMATMTFDGHDEQLWKLSMARRVGITSATPLAIAPRA